MFTIPCLRALNDQESTQDSALPSTKESESPKTPTVALSIVHEHKTLSLQVENNISIAEVKHMIHEVHGIDTSHHQLILSEELLADNTCLFEYPSILNQNQTIDLREGLIFSLVYTRSPLFPSFSV